MGNPTVQEEIEAQFANIKNALNNERGSQREEQVNKQIQKLFNELSASVSVREGKSTARASRYVGPDSENRPLLMLYLEEAEKMAASLLEKGKGEKGVFLALFRREPQPGETIAGELATIKAALQDLYDQNKKMLIKNPRARQYLNQIWTRKLTPQELFSSTATKGYNEIGLRTHKASDEVRASHAQFAGIVLEESMALNTLSDGMAQIKIPAKSDAQPSDVEEIIATAYAQGLPCFVI